MNEADTERLMQLGAERRDAMLVPTANLSYLAMTTEQARILSLILHKQRDGIVKRWSPGIYTGLSEALWTIETAGGAYVQARPFTRSGGGR